MPANLFRGPAILLCILLTAVVVALHLVSPDNWSIPANRLVRSLHGPGFAVVAYLVFQLVRRSHSDNSALLIAAASSFGLAVLAEVSQIFGPRSAELKDLAVDSVGIVSGIFFAFVTSKKRTNRQHRMAVIIASTILLAVCSPTLWRAYSLTEQKRTFPQLLTFDHAWESSIYDEYGTDNLKILELTDNWTATNGNVAVISESGTFGIFLALYPNQDWTNYSRLRFTAASRDAPFSLNVGIRQFQQSPHTPNRGYYEDMMVEKEPSDFVIDLDFVRQGTVHDWPDLSLVEAVVFAASKPGQGQTLVLDNVRLEN